MTDKDYPVDLSNTHANIDFLIFDYDDGINFKGCKIKNLNSLNRMLKLSDFDQKVIDENKWKYKPRTCCIFPLRRRNGKLELLINKKDDPNVYDDYNGYESCLPCFKKIKYNELEEEYRYYNNQ